MASLSEEILSNSNNKENRSLEEMPLVSALQRYFKSFDSKKEKE